MSTMKFCIECNNLLYPREDRSGASRRLLYACRNCPYAEPAESNCVYINEIKAKSIANIRISKETALDPALNRRKDITCRNENCGNGEAVFFARSEENMELIFVCTNPDCNHHWLQSDAK
jgi:DNA-directed RNA polymerase II subunit RPB9